MENFIFGLQSIAHYTKVSTLDIIRHQLVWGFSLGLIASTLIHAIVVSDNPRQIPHMLTKKASDAFNHIASQEEDGQYNRSYTDFQREYNRVRIVFFGALLSFFVVVAISLLRY